MKRKLLAFMAVLLATTAVLSDTLHQVDSLLKVFEQPTEPKRSDAARQLLDFYAKEDIFFAEAPTMTRGSSREQQNLTVWFAAERFYTSKAYFKEALGYIEKALPLARAASTQKERDIYETMLCDKSYCLFKTSEYTQAIEAGREAVRLTQQSENWMQLSRAYLYLSLVNHSLRKYDEAKALVVKAIETNERLGLNIQTHNALGVACEIFCSAMEVDEAISYGKRAVEAAREIGYMPGVANHLTQLSYAYDRKGDYQQGLKYADEAIAMVKANDPLDRNQLALSLEYKSWNLIDIGRPREAAEALREAIRLEQEVGNTHAVWYDYRTLAEALESFDPHGSIEALKRYTRMGDSIHSEQLKDLMSQANAEFHNDELKGENTQLTEANAQIRRQNNIIFWTALSVMLLLIAAIASLWFAFRQKQRANKAMSQIAKTREEFFTNVTHELRTPLTVILGIGNQLKRIPPENKERIMEAGTTIVRHGEQLLSLVNQMLDISKVKSAIGKPERSVGNLSAYMDMLIEGYQELARQKNIQLEYTTDETPIISVFSVDYMQKVVSNLLSNAIKFTRSGGKVNVSMHQKQNKIVLTVSDNGMGIAPQHLPHIFEPFYQADNSDGMGSGVGLALVKQIMDNTGGKVEVSSTEGVGTTFRVITPIISKSHETYESNEAHETHEPYEPYETPPQSPNRPTLLIVEDNHDVAKLIGEQAGDNYNIRYAADGVEGLQKARLLIPDIIITDVMMPRMDGLSLCRAIREDESINHIPIIMVTAKATEKDRISGLRAGADVYLFKPFNSEELNLQVSHLLEQREQLRRRYQQPLPGKEPDEQQATLVSSQKEQKEQGQPSGSFKYTSEEFVERLRLTVAEQLPKGKVEVEDIARQLFISPSHLRRKMNAITGMSPKKYIQKMQLEMARELLRQHPEKTITEVAEACGFYDHSHFLRTYRDTFGTAPRSGQ